MKKLGWIISKIKSKFCKAPKSYEIMNNYYRRGGAHIGNNCCICSNLDLCEKELLFIGDNVIISTDVLFVTHDVSASITSNKEGSFFGKIVIGNNNFIGERSTLIYGVSLADNIIVAAGSVVTKSFPKSGIIIGGNPAHIIGNVDDFVKKNDNNYIMLSELKRSIENNDVRLIKR